MIYLNNAWMELCIKSDDKLFRVVEICNTVKEADSYIQTNENVGLIATDTKDRYYVVELEGMKS